MVAFCYYHWILLLIFVKLQSQVEWVWSTASCCPRPGTFAALQDFQVAHW